MVQGRDWNHFIDQVTSPISSISLPTGLTGYFILGKEASERAEIIKRSVSVRIGEMREMGETANEHMCDYSTPDNRGGLNCLRADGHIGKCTCPCPWEDP